MQLNFAEQIAALTIGGVNPAFRLINGARPASDYLFASILPERLQPDYEVRSGSMTIRATMAGLTGMDSPYPPVGLIETSEFNERTAKVASYILLNEETRRTLRRFAQAMSLGGQNSDQIQNTILNFADKLITQPHLDTFEYLRGEALVYGKLDWIFGNIRLQVDYAYPAANLLTQRSGADHYGGATSKFWTDYRAARSLLKGQIRLAVAHPDTIDLIISNAVNTILLIEQDSATGSVSFVKNVGTGGQQIPSPDARDRTRLVGYGLEGDILDPTNPGKTIGLPFLSKGKVLYVGNPPPAGFTVGLGGATEGPTTGLELGYTHIGPTEEGDGAMGRWARVYTPQERPWEVKGDGVTNGLPVIEANDRVVVASTDMA